MSRAILAASALLAMDLIRSLHAAPPQAGNDHGFSETVRPFLQNYCIGCHGGAQPAAQFDLRKYTVVQTVNEDLSRWSPVLLRLASGTMPPKGGKQPTDAERQAVMAWITYVRNDAARKNAG